ncbi:protein NO VEIN isoform X1 [Lathyrus oleraceus]|uniref:protein NO VEIN isoform X1 n=1 Tax=Pisum sativum TaxID=3888 RepID=UPI0021D0813B|nr:protein NO VEIN isoform X1 [Pisum sativum]
MYPSRFSGGYPPPGRPPSSTVSNPNAFFQAGHNLHPPNASWPLPFQNYPSFAPPPQNPYGFAPPPQNPYGFAPPPINPPGCDPPSQNHPCFAPRPQNPSGSTAPPQNLPGSTSRPQNQPGSAPLQQNPKQAIGMAENASSKACRDLLAAGDSVSAWKVSQKALLTLQVDSLNSLGIKMQQVPTLHRLMLTEGKVNAFIHCFVGVRRITSLYDLEVSICNNEGVGSFEELGLGPFLRHPLVIHYFSIRSDVTEVFKITSEEIIQFLSKFLDVSKAKAVIGVEDFLEFIATKRSVERRELLGIRIQNLGMHITAIREAKKAEESTIEKCLKTLRSKSDKFRNRPISSSQKKQLDERFSTIAQRVESFSSVEKSFCGKHVRFTSSSSEDEVSDYSTDNDQNDNIIMSSWSNPSSKFGKSSERMSSCPYPSATEEMARLVVKGDKQGDSLSNSSLRKGFSEPPSKKRKTENVTSTKPFKFLNFKYKKVDPSPTENVNTTKVSKNMDKYLSITDDSLQMFVTTWKEACLEHKVAEVLERMLQFYGVKPREKNKIRMLLMSYPFLVGLLNAAVSAIKSGMWNSIYDTFQVFNNSELTNSPTKSSEYETLDIEPSLENVPLVAKDNAENTNLELITGISAEDVVRKIGMYFDLDNEVYRNSDSQVKYKIMFLRKFCNCESWLAEQFGVKNFNSLGHGDLLSFLENSVDQFPRELLKLLGGGMCENSSFKACMSSNELVALLSQAISSLWENETVTKQIISMLLMRQFPSIGFEFVESGSLEDLLDTVREHKSNVTSKCVVFSAAMIEEHYHIDSLSDGDNNWSGITTDSSEMCHKTKRSETITAKNAMEVLLKSPMLSDLSKWSHWDLMFAPSLGSLMSWLLNDVNTEELLCLVTRDGKVIRIDHSATSESFLVAAVQGSSFQTAVSLLSLISLLGGKRKVPLSLLKRDSCSAFKVLFRNFVEDIEVGDDKNAFQSNEALCKTQIVTEVSTTKMSGEFGKHLLKVKKVVSIMSKFVLDCLGYLPAEFHSFAADVLLSGMRSVFKDAAVAILCECSNMEQHLMLHEIGLSLGITEWINDYHAFISNNTFDQFCAHVSCLKDGKTKISTGLKHDQEFLDKSLVPELDMVTSHVPCGLNERCTEISQTVDAEKSIDKSMTSHIEDSLQSGKDIDSTLVIESIRQDEFGLDPSLSDSDSCMLKKQHARLGRALHCLSQELYSQDSHFILELVQNADDNNYPESVEPTLAFILQDSGIAVLNNERGFSAQNMRALCDVGNSTKKGSNTGYIGKKGIGFKSVFRVTDAPEIHSNGFHVKFDISEGQIGFVLPTLVPPCDIELLRKMAFTGTDSYSDNPWNTCILLPFRSHLSEGTVINNIMTMFSDLHPSLLLFLHRLQCIKLRNLLNDTLIVMKKEISEDGIIKVSHGKEKMSWFVVSQKLQTNSIRFDVQTTEISMAFTLQESDDGYSPCLNQQPVFAFLPLRTYGLKFILQGDFVLPSSREEVDGDSPWNQWLLSEYPNLFVRAVREFCELPCFRSEPGKGLSAFLSFIPLVGEVHGFFSTLPRLIISKLRMMNCLIVEGDNNGWAPPCKVLRGWTDQVRCLLPDNVLLEHLGLRYLDKNVLLSDTLARALGVEEFGPSVLVRVMSSLCCTKNGLISMNMSWLASCLNTLYVLMFDSSGTISINFEVKDDILKRLKKTPFIPLSDGTYGSVDEGTIWLQSNTLNTGFDGEHKMEAFPNICARLRTVSPSLLSAASGTSSLNMTSLDNVTRLLETIGVQQLSAHDVVKLHILPVLSDETMASKNKTLMIEYICFVMLHLKSTCSDCFIEREHIISELQCKSLLLTDCGFKCPAEVPIHFSTEFGNPVTAKKLADAVNMRWHEVDISYLKHPVNESVSSSLVKWREFFEEIGITNFAQIVQVEKSVVNICDATFKQEMWDRGLISAESIVKDWESPEIVQLVSLLSNSGDQENCKYLLEVLDTLWDACYGDKARGYFVSKSVGDGHPFKSTFISNLCDIQWVVSTMDGELHYPKDLFYDCEAVRLILGAFAPYAVPKVKSERLVNDIGLKTRVTLGDILNIFEAWRKSSKTSFKASISQMSKFYTFIWKEMAAPKQKILQDLVAGPFIFVPNSAVHSHNDDVFGTLVRPNEVYWHDPTGSVQKMEEFDTQSSSSHSRINKSLCNIYPGLRGFFVDECGVQEAPPLHSYIQILLQLSTVTLPSQAADKIFQVFLVWADGLKSGLLNVEDVVYLKDCLSKLEFPVLPTVQDKWVSLHPSFGLICWCDDKELKEEFKHSDNLDFLYFGEVTEDNKEKVLKKISFLMKNLGIPAISEVVTREAIYYGLSDCSFKESLINITLPYAQRYIYKSHHDKYIQLKQSGFGILNDLKVIVVEKLFYRNVIKGCDSVSNKRVECSCLLQGNILYTIQEADHLSLFMELSTLLLDGIDGDYKIHMANFLHTITNSSESESREKMLNSQKVPKLPDEEPVWALSTVSSMLEDEISLPSDYVSSSNEQTLPLPKRKSGMSSNWPPADWKNAPDFNYARANGFKTQPALISSSVSEVKNDDNFEQGSVSVDRNVIDDLQTNSASLALHETENFKNQSYHDFEPTSFHHIEFDPASLGDDMDESRVKAHSGSTAFSTPAFSMRDRLQTGTYDAAQANATGRLGELLAYKYFTAKDGNTTVSWVNEVNETGLPFDLIIGEGANKEYIEVKATRSPRKDWFHISTREWQFAVEKGESFSIAFVAITGDNNAQVAVFKDPARLCQQGGLQLVVMMAKQQRQLPVVS